MLKRIKWQLVLAIFWFGSPYLAMGALLPWEWAWRCAWLNLIIGLLGLLLVTQTEEGDRIFYFGPSGDEPGRWEVAVLWAMPVVIMFLAIIGWVMRLVGLFDW